MRLTTKGRYAVTAMLDLTVHGDSKTTSLASVSSRQSISLSYLEQLFARLRQAGLVVSVRGPGGGYRLNRPSNEIAIADIVGAVNESLDTTHCKGKSDCQQGEVCLTHALWDELSGEIQRFLSCISLADLVARKDIQAISERQALRALVFMDSDSASDGEQDQTQEDQVELDSTMRGTVSQQKNSQDNLQASAC
jgi:Rrf2 family iron-sulfur cluster assembly transcriptional regulator